MAQNYINKGGHLDYTVPTGQSVVSGDVVVIGDTAGVATGSASAGETVVVACFGAWTLPKATTSGNAFAQGEKVYYDTSTKKCVTDDTKMLIGFAYTAAAQAATTVGVTLTP